MTDNRKYFINLISCFLNSTSPVGTAEDWDEIYKLADINGISGVIAQEIKLLPEECRPQKELKSYFNQCMGYTIQDYEIKINAQKEINAFLNKENVDHIFVKGSVIREYYPVPELRTSGDIDIIVRDNEYDRITEIFKSSKFKIESITAETLIVKLCNVTVEIHRGADVFGHYYKNDIFEYCAVEGNNYTLNRYDNLLYIILHLAKHLVYRGAGIRMLMDIDVCIRSIENFDESKFILMCRKAGVEKCAKMLFSLCRLWFKTPVSSFYELENNSELLQLLEHTFLDGGCFGYNVNALGSHYVSKTKSSKIGVREKLKAFFIFLFPSPKAMQKKYLYASKHKILTPVAYVNRFIEGIFKRGKHSVNTVKEIASADEGAVLEAQILSELDIK